MKTILTLIFTTFIGFAAMAQTTGKEVKVETQTKKVELNINTTIQKVEIKKVEIARVYMNKNYRVKRALNFTTKSNKSKMA